MKVKNFTLLFVLLLLFFSCQRKENNQDFIQQEETVLYSSADIELLKDQLTNEAIHFFDLNYLSNNNTHFTEPETDINPNMDQQASSRNEESRLTMIQVVYDALLVQNANQAFVSTVIEEIGYPVWDKSLLIETPNSQVNALILPFAKIEDNFISASVLVNIVNEIPTFFVRADKSIMDVLIENTLPQNAKSEDIPFHLAAFLTLDFNIFSTQNAAYLSWLDNYDQLNNFTENGASQRCESVSVTFCVCDLAFDGGNHATDRNNRCYTATTLINCDQYDGGNGTIGGEIPSGSTFPSNPSGGSSTNNHNNNNNTTVQQLLQNCNDHLNATGDEGTLPDLLPVEIKFCQLITDILALVSLSNEEILWLNQDHVNNSGFFSHLTLIRAYLLSDNFDPTSGKDQDMFNTYMDLLVNEEIDIPISHFAYLYDFKNGYDIDMSYADLAEIIDESACINSGNFDDCAWATITTGIIANLVQEGLISGDDPTLNSQVAESIAWIVKNGWLKGPYPENQQEAIIEDSGFPSPAHYAEYLAWCQILSIKWANDNPGQTLDILDELKIAAEAYWKTIIGELHVALDFCGLIPGGGEPCDLVNGVLYTIEGDGINASFSFAATIPIYGWVSTGAKYAKIAVEVNGKLLKLTIKNINGIMNFGSRSKLRTMLNLGSSPQQAHHLISWAKQDHHLVQYAAKADELPFHMNHPHNGKAVDAWKNQPNHNDYNIRIQQSLDKIFNLKFNGDLTNISPNLVTAELRKLETFLANKIDEFPNLHLNDIIFEYVP